ncbi:MAG: inactive transglutaminase family protein [Gammaproteobacteria bacterium]
MKNLHVNLLALVLIAVGAVICYYKVTELRLPLLPEAQTELWTVEAKVTYHATKGSAKVGLLLPNNPDGYLILDENFVSGRYGLAVEEKSRLRAAQWTLRRPQGSQSLYYRLQLIPDDHLREPEKNVRFPEKKEFPEMIQTAVNALLEEVRSKSADTKSFTHELLLLLNVKNPSENIALLREGVEDGEEWVERIANILQGARIPARQVNLLMLKDGVRHGKLVPWLQVYNGEEWLPFDPKTGESGFPQDALIWHFGDQPLLSVKGGSGAKVEFSVYKQSQDMAVVAQQRAKKINSRVMDFSLFNLPVQTQNVYRILLMVPIGALLIVLLRNVIGIKSFGTFMPILIAMAFRETELMWGLVLFILLIALGLSLRFYLEYLQLLLVPRLAAVLIIVILLMLIVSLLSHKMGMERGLSVALFPMVIIAMTIERMSLVWEEHGPGEAFQQGAGSLFIASLSYLLMTNDRLEHLIFVFPELLFVLLACTLLLGRYTGYRLTELWRFRSLLRE